MENKSVEVLYQAILDFCEDKSIYYSQSIDKIISQLPDGKKEVVDELLTDLVNKYQNLKTST